MGMDCECESAAHLLSFEQIVGRLRSFVEKKTTIFPVFKLGVIEDSIYNEYVDSFKIAQ